MVLKSRMGPPTIALHSFSQATITKYHGMEVYTTEMYLFFHSSGGQKSKIKLLSGLISSEASFLGLQIAVFSLCSHMMFRVCAQMTVSKFSLRTRTPVILD